MELHYSKAFSFHLQLFSFIFAIVFAHNFIFLRPETPRESQQNGNNLLNKVSNYYVKMTMFLLRSTSGEYWGRVQDRATSRFVFKENTGQGDTELWNRQAGSSHLPSLGWEETSPVENLDTTAPLPKFLSGSSAVDANAGFL